MLKIRAADRVRKTTKPGQHSKACIERGGPQRIARLERACCRLEHLADISKLLTCFQSVEQTVPAVLAVIGETLPLRSAIFILKTGDAEQTMSWQATPLELSRSTSAAGPTDAGSDPHEHWLSLPLAIDHPSISGALQIQGTMKLQEDDLVYVTGIADQLAVALNRYLADRALRNSEARLAGIIAIAADAIISIDEEQKILMYNEGAEKIFGWTRTEMLGQSLTRLIPARFREVHGAHVHRFGDGERTACKMGEGHTSFLGLRKNGQEFPADSAISKLDIGGSKLFTVVLRDITEQKRVEYAEQFLAEIGVSLASTLDYQQTATNVVRLVLANLGDLCSIELLDEQAALRRVEVLSSDPAKAEIAEALKRFPSLQDRPHPSWTILQSKQSLIVPDFSAEMLRALAQNEEHWRLLEALGPCSVMGVPLMVQGRVLGALLVASCRPERRYVSSDLRLLEEVGRRAALALENARLYRATQRAIQGRDDVLGIVAHDLRNPVNAILLQAYRLTRGASEQGSDRRKPAESIERAARHMDRLIQDLLDVTRIEAGRLSIERAPVPLDKVMSDSVEAQRPLASARSLELRTDLPDELPEIWADRDRLLQVFENLIGNATKFTGAGGSITIGARPRIDDVLFWVADTGVGVAPADIPHLFDRFWQARKAGRRGAGLGLPIVKGIIEAHGGRVWVENAPARGITFLFSIPFTPPVEDRPSLIPSAPDSSIAERGGSAQ